MAIINKASTGTTLNAGSAWVGGVAPGSADLATWVSGSTSGNQALGGTLTWGGIRSNTATTQNTITGTGIQLNLTGWSDGTTTYFVDMSSSSTPYFWINTGVTLNFGSGSGGVIDVSTQFALLNPSIGSAPITKNGPGLFASDGVSPSWTSPITFNAGSLALSSASTSSNTTYGTGLFTFNGGTVFNQSATVGNTRYFTNPVNIRGNVSLGGNPSTTYFSGSSAFDLDSVTRTLTCTGAVVIARPMSGSAGFSLAGSGTLTLIGTNTFTGAVNIASGNLAIGEITDLGTLGLNDGADVSIPSGLLLRLRRSSNRTYTGIISGAGTVSLEGGARATLSGSNTFTSAASAIALTTNGTILTLTNSDSMGSGTTTGVTVNANTALELNASSSDIVTPAKAISLNGTGPGSAGAIRNVAGNNTYTGAITLVSTSSMQADAGSLTLNSASAITGNTFSLSFFGAGTFDISSAINTTTGAVSRSSGAGALILRGTSSYSGTTTVSAGVLGFTGSIAPSVAGNFGNAATAIVVAEGATLRYYGSGSATFTRSISLTGGTTGATYKFESNGTGAVTHSAAPSFATTAIAKTLQLGGTGTASNTIGYTIVNNSGGALSIVKADAGKWVLSNTNNSYSGGTTVNASGGTLVLSVASWTAGAKVTGTGGVTVNGNGKIQTLAGSGGTAQLGRHTYPSLSFAAIGRIRIGG